MLASKAQPSVKAILLTIKGSLKHGMIAVVKKVGEMQRLGGSRYRLSQRHSSCISQVRPAAQKKSLCRAPCNYMGC